MTDDRTSAARVDYDRVAPTYERRYAWHDWRDIEGYLRRFVHDRDRLRVVEVGCGTGHWLSTLGPDVAAAVGIDRSAGMLQGARAAVPQALLVRAPAERLPLAHASVDRVFSVHALHHFDDAASAIRECRRVLRPGGGYVNIGLDPHDGRDAWWIYEFFPGTLAADRARYTAVPAVEALLAASGFARITTELVQHAVAAVPYAQAERSGMLDRSAASQLMIISDREYRSGLERLRVERPVLRTALRVHATCGWVEPA